jgi:cold shock CspA family protein
VVEPRDLAKLASGVKVEVEVEKGTRGPRAKQVKVIA